MADNSDAILRNSLDAVDRGRRWAILGVAALLVATVIAVASLFAAAAARQVPGQQPGVFKALVIVAASQMLFVACCTVVLMFHVTRNTKAVLRAMEASHSER